ncbi:hypothetical protein ACJX0J_035757, partial [Zea mays]
MPGNIIWGAQALTELMITIAQDARDCSVNLEVVGVPTFDLAALDLPFLEKEVAFIKGRFIQDNYMLCGFVAAVLEQVGKERRGLPIQIEKAVVVKLADLGWTTA